VRNLKALLYAIADEVEETVKSMVRKMDLGEDLGIGADGTPTKLIDDVAEQVVFKVLKDKGEDLKILSEEAGSIDNNAEKTLQTFSDEGLHVCIVCGRASNI